MAEKNATLLQPTATGAASRTRTSLWALSSFLLIGVVALVPRALDLGLFITDDEANFWLRRSEVFLNALRSGDFIQTAITTHPGVTTMWLGASGILLRGALLNWGILHSDTFPIVLATMRLPVVLVHTAVILASYGLLRRMFAPLLALLAALLWAADPFIVGYSRLLHTDALAMSFAALSLLAALYRWNHDGGRRWLIVSGISAGLAFLSKSPSLVLLPVVGIVALLALERSKVQTFERSGNQEPRTENQEPMARRRVAGSADLVFGLRSLVGPLALWSAVAAVTVFALWPALWVSPAEAYRQVQLGVVAEGAQPHMLGNFFLGREDDAPGLLYYPVALALRLTPWTFAGLLLLPIVWRWSSWSPAHRRDFAALAAFVVLFVAAMSFFPKKFDRYMVPAFPALDILAAAGIVAIGDWVSAIRSKRSTNAPIADRQSLISAVLATLVALAALANAAWWQPYQINAFNQLFGGTATGARTFFMGWGEGLEQVADWLNAQPDITSVRTVALRVTSLNPYLKSGAQADFPKGDQLRDRTGYVVVYLPQVQAGTPGVPFDRFFGKRAPLHVVSIHGVDVAWIYRAPPSVGVVRSAGFGSDIKLVGFDQNGDWTRGQTTRLRLVWEAQAQPTADYWMFAHVIGANGQPIVRLDLPQPTSQWATGQFAETELPIDIPADAPTGEYRLLIGLYAPENGQRLALTPGESSTAAPDSDNALELARFALP